MFTTSRVLLLATLFAVAPVLFVTLQTLRAAWSQETTNRQGKEVVSAGAGVRIDEIKAQLAGGPEAIRARKDSAAGLPVTEFFRTGFVAPPLNVPAVPGSNDKAWDELGSSLAKLNSSREAFEIAEKHIGQRPLSVLVEEQLASFAAELAPVAAAVPSLKDWPQRLLEMSKDRKATQHFLDKLNVVSRDLSDRTNTESSALSRISDVDLRKWSQQLTDLKSTKSGTASIDNFPTIVEQHKELKRRVDFWACWNPPMPVGNAKPTAAMLESRRTALIQLEKKAKATSDGEARLPEEIEHTEKVSKEIDRLVGEGLYLSLKESLVSKKNAPKSMAELLQKMQPIIDTGAHRDDLLKDFKEAVELWLAAKKTAEPKLPVYDFYLSDRIWLAHWDGKIGLDSGYWIYPYDFEKDAKITTNGEYRYLREGSGFSKVISPEEMRIVNEFNKARDELLKNLDQSDSWKALQAQCAAQEKQLAAYYRQMKQFWERSGTGKHRLAPDLSFTADQKLISDVLEHWSIVESLYRR